MQWDYLADPEEQLKRYKEEAAVNKPAMAQARADLDAERRRILEKPLTAPITPTNQPAQIQSSSPGNPPMPGLGPNGMPLDLYERGVMQEGRRQLKANFLKNAEERGKYYQDTKRLPTVIDPGAYSVQQTMEPLMGPRIAADPSKAGLAEVTTSGVLSGITNYIGSVANTGRMIAKAGLKGQADIAAKTLPQDLDPTGEYRRQLEDYRDADAEPGVKAATKFIEDLEKITMGLRERRSKSPKGKFGDTVEAATGVIASALTSALVFRGVPLPAGKLGTLTRMIPFGAMAAGGAAREAENQGADFSQQVINGVLIGAGEMLTEMIPLDRALDTIKALGAGEAVEAGARNLVQKYGAVGFKWLQTAVAEFIQEAAMEPYSKSIQKLTYDPSMQWTGQGSVTDLNAIKDAGLGGIALASLLGALGLPFAAASTNRVQQAIETGEPVQSVMKDLETMLPQDMTQNPNIEPVQPVEQTPIQQPQPVEPLQEAQQPSNVVTPPQVETPPQTPLNPSTQVVELPKENWQMTKAEYRAQFPTESAANLKELHGTHRESVVGALISGEQVPSEVLADYPDIDNWVQLRKEQIAAANPNAARLASAKVERQTKEAQTAKAEEEKAERLAASEKQRAEEEKSRKNFVENKLWQMTQKEYVGNKRGAQKELLQYDHQQAVEKAIAEGKRVPVKVLADYPNLGTMRPQNPAYSEKEIRETASYLRAVDRETQGETLYQRIKKRGGIAPASDVAGEYRESIPVGLRNKSGLPLDEMADEMGMTSAELLEQIQQERVTRTKPDYRQKAIEFLDQEAERKSNLERLYEEFSREVDSIIGEEKRTDLLRISPFPNYRQGPNDFSFSDPDIEQRYRAAHGVPKETQKGKAVELLRTLYNKATREYEFLPKTAEFSQLRFDLNKLAKQKEVAGDKTIRLQQGITIDLKDSPKEFVLFERKVLLDDLLEEAKAGHNLPFGFTEETLKAELKRLDGELQNFSNVTKAIDKRKKVWDAIKSDYIAAQEAIGNKVADRFNKENYFRHQVLEYMNLKGMTGTGKKLKTPSNRGFLRKREGSSYDINTNYLEAEYEVMAQMLYDIEVAKVINLVKKSYNIQPALRKSARKQNEESIMEYFEDLADEMNEKIDDPKKYVDAEKLYKQLNKKQAMGFSRLTKLAKDGVLPDTQKEKWKSVIESFADGGTENEQTMAYLSWVLENHAETEAGQTAALIFKGIREKTEFMQEKLGKKYVTWEDIIPDGYVLWQPKEGNIFYFVDSIPEKVAEQLYSGALEQIGIQGKDIRKVLAKGQRLNEFVVKEEVAKTLDNLVRERPVDPVKDFAKSVMLKWKKWQLISPFRLVKYNLRNISGDADAVMVGNPSAFKKVPQAIRELTKVYTSDAPLPKDMQYFFEVGGMQSTQQAQEMGDLNSLRMFQNMLDKQGTTKEIPTKIIQGYWKTARLSTDFREAILRYSAYLDYLDQMQKNNGVPKNFGASNREEVMALSDIRDRAFKLSNELLGAYDEVGVLVQEASDSLLPFFRWKAVNASRYVKLFKNAAYDGQLATAASKSAFTIAKRSPFIALKVGTFLLKASALWAMLSAYNNLFFRDEEEDLPDDVRNAPHIILGRDKNGKVLYFDRLGAVGDLLEWFSLDAPQKVIADYLNGKKTLKDIATDAVKAPVNVIVQGVGPQYKTPAELLSGKRFFPNVFEPGSIRNGYQYLAQSLGLGDVYNKLTGLPQRPDTLARFFVYNQDPGEAAYYDVLGEKREYQKSIGKYSGITSEGNERSNALYYMKQAARYGDRTAFEKYIAEYFNAGGSKRGMEQSLNMLDPLYGMRDKESGLDEEGRKFVNEWLDDEGRERLSEAERFYKTVIKANFNVYTPRKYKKEAEK